LKHAMWFYLFLKLFTTFDQEKYVGNVIFCIFRFRRFALKIVDGIIFFLKYPMSHMDFSYSYCAHLWLYVWVYDTHRPTTTQNNETINPDWILLDILKYSILWDFVDKFIFTSRYLLSWLYSYSYQFDCELIFEKQF